MSMSIRLEPIFEPITRCPKEARLVGSRSMLTPEAGMPTITRLPPGRSNPMPCSIATLLPTATKT
jgi:hypothetical protein